MSEKETPRGKVNKNRYNKNYKKEHCKVLSVMMYENTDSRYIRLWKTIPNKAQWLREQLDEYAKENSLD